MPVPRTQDEYLDLVDQVIYEIDEVMMCAQDEGDPEDYEFSELLPIYERLSAELRKLHANVMKGLQLIGQGQDLPFMTAAARWKERMPFYDLLTELNHVHKTGF